MKHLFSFRPRLALLGLGVLALAVTWLTGLQADHAGLLLATGAAGLSPRSTGQARWSPDAL